MHMTRLRKVGGSVMLAVPPALLDVLRLGAGGFFEPLEGGAFGVRMGNARGGERDALVADEFLKARGVGEGEGAEHEAWGVKGGHGVLLKEADDGFA